MKLSFKFSRKEKLEITVVILFVSSVLSVMHILGANFN